jgi:hypothetical protein
MFEKTLDFRGDPNISFRRGKIEGKYSRHSSTPPKKSTTNYTEKSEGKTKKLTKNTQIFMEIGSVGVSQYISLNQFQILIFEFPFN